MNPHPNGRVVARFLGRLAIIYLLLVLPWPGLRDVYGDYFRAVAKLVFGHDERRLVRLLPLVQVDGVEHPMDTQLALANRERLDANGKGQVLILGISLRAVAWLPAALLSALVLASPLAWSRRCRALGCGLLLIHVHFLLFVGACIWKQSDESNGLGLVAAGPLLRSMIVAFEKIMTNSGVHFVVPVVVWVVVTFRRDDFSRIGGCLG